MGFNRVTYFWGKCMAQLSPIQLMECFKGIQTSALENSSLCLPTILFNVSRNSFMIDFLFSEFWFAKFFCLRIKNEKWHLQHLSLPFFSGLGFKCFKCFKCVTIERLLSKPNLQKQSQKQFAAPQNRLPIFAKCFFLLKFRLDGWLAVPAVCRNRTRSKILFKILIKIFNITFC